MKREDSLTGRNVLVREVKEAPLTEKLVAKREIKLFKLN